MGLCPVYAMPLHLFMYFGSDSMVMWRDSAEHSEEIALATTILPGMRLCDFVCRLFCTVESVQMLTILTFLPYQSFQVTVTFLWANGDPCYTILPLTVCQPGLDWQPQQQLFRKKIAQKKSHGGSCMVHGDGSCMVLAAAACCMGREIHSPLHPPPPHQTGVKLLLESSADSTSVKSIVSPTQLQLTLLSLLYPDHICEDSLWIECLVSGHEIIYTIYIY